MESEQTQVLRGNPSLGRKTSVQIFLIIFLLKLIIQRNINL